MFFCKFLVKESVVQIHELAERSLRGAKKNFSKSENCPHLAWTNPVENTLKVVENLSCPHKTWTKHQKQIFGKLHQTAFTHISHTTVRHTHTLLHILPNKILCTLCTSHSLVTNKLSLKSSHFLCNLH